MVDADGDGVPAEQDCNDDDEALAAVADDADCDGIVTAEDCDDADSGSTAVADDADCDGIVTAEDCDDADSGSTAVADDADCDGVVTDEDCDDDNAESNSVSEDGDCDGVLTLDDCDDSDVLSSVVAEDGDCDGVLTDDDCDDTDVLSSVVAEDGDCDGVLTDDDCDDTDVLSSVVAEDGDCDGILTLDDCDDADASVGAAAADLDCDGVLNEDDNCPLLANPGQEDSDQDLWGDLCDPFLDLVEFAMAPGSDPLDPANQDCITPSVCLTRGSGMGSGPYNAVSESVFSASTSPLGASWAPGYAGELMIAQTWLGAVQDGSNMPYMPVNVYIAAEDEHYNLLATEWPDDSAASGFAYVRSRVAVFAKAAYADPTDAANQDCITPAVCIARGNNQGIYNTVLQASYSGGGPSGTEWALGATAEVDPSSYSTWSAAVSSNPVQTIGQVMSLHILGTELYYDLVFTEFGQGNTGGAFAYRRARALVPGCADPSASNYDSRVTVADGWCGDWLLFNKESGADHTQAANQDCITAGVCLTRAQSQGPFNAVTEQGFQSSSPEGTAWAPGLTAAVEAADYHDWEGTMQGNPRGAVGLPYSIQMTADGSAYDIVMLRWGGGGTGGAMRYLRRLPRCGLDHTTNLLADDGDCDGFVTSIDCDDADPGSYPGAPESCDGLDNDCDGSVPVNEVVDGDSDSFVACADCDDGDGSIYPGAVETCDGVDGNCDGTLAFGDASLATSFNSNNGNLGNVFDVSVLQDLNINGFAWNLASFATVTVDIYYKQGSGLADHADASAWTLLEQFSVPGQGQDNPTALPLSQPLGLTPGTWSFTFHSSESIRYISGTSLGAVYASDSFLEIEEGYGKGILFGSSTFSPRVWSGSIEYTTSNELDDDGDNYFACEECDDSDPGAVPGGAEDFSTGECFDGLDNDCDGLTDTLDPDCQVVLPPPIGGGGGGGGGILN